MLDYPCITVETACLEFWNLFTFSCKQQQIFIIVVDNIIFSAYPIIPVEPLKATDNNQCLYILFTLY